MKFRTIPDPGVTLAVSFLTPAQQQFYRQQILPALEDDPFPVDRSSLIESRIDDDGRVFYQYYDGIVPLVFQYRVFLADVDSQPRFIWVAVAMRDDER